MEHATSSRSVPRDATRDANARSRTHTTILVAALLVAAALPVVATHDGDDHSDNMALTANVPPSTDAFQTDLAFWGKLAFAGNYDGFRILDVASAKNPKVLADVECRGPQNDVSVWEGLMFQSVDAPQTAIECSEDTPTGVTGFEGVRVWDVSNPRAPQFVTGVPTDCGSHTHTLVPDVDNDRVLLYVSSYPLTNQGPTPYGTTCAPPHSKISIVEVPLDDPARARVIAEPVFPMVGLFLATPVQGCHDISVFMELDLAAAACLGEGQIWDISDPARPQLLHRIHNPAVNVWHSATFTWDGEMVVFGDEFLGALGPGCHDDPGDLVGAVWFYAVDHPVAPLGSYNIPRAQDAPDRCTMHNFNVLTRTDRHILVASTYVGGTTVVDFTDPANAHEVAYYDAADPDSEAWSSYWYNGRVYANDMNRGVDVFQLDKDLTGKTERLRHLNPQTQESLINGPR